MNSLLENIKNHAAEVEAVWGLSYSLFNHVIESKQLKVDLEIGVAFGGHDSIQQSKLMRKF
jgi:hypothetical protein